MSRLAICLVVVGLAAGPAAFFGSDSPKPTATPSLSSATSEACRAAVLAPRWHEQKWEFEETEGAIRLTTPIPFDTLVGTSSSTAEATHTKPIAYQIGVVKNKPLLIVVDTPEGELANATVDGECPKPVAVAIDTLVEALAATPDSFIERCRGKKRCIKTCPGPGGREYCCAYTCDDAS